MKFTARAYQGSEDYWKMRNFLRQVMLRNDRHEFCWHVARLDYWWWFCNPDLEKLPLEKNIFLWEDESGELGALLLPEGPGQAFPQIHPDFYSDSLIEHVISLALDRMVIKDQDGFDCLSIYVDSQASSIHRILINHGFEKSEHPEAKEIQHRRLLDEPLPEAPMVQGYTIRSLGDGLELLERCYASGLGFHRDDIQTARENRDNSEWYHHIQTAPLYRRDLDIVAVASDGSIASFCTIWFDDVTRTAYFEPVATIPSQQKKGLGKAVMIEGLIRLKRMGCKVAFVSGYSMAAISLYHSIMGSDIDISEPWVKITRAR